jgi:hypothetical protein
MTRQVFSEVLEAPVEEIPRGPFSPPQESRDLFVVVPRQVHSDYRASPFVETAHGAEDLVRHLSKLMLGCRIPGAGPGHLHLEGDVAARATLASNQVYGSGCGCAVDVRRRRCTNAFRILQRLPESDPQLLEELVEVGGRESKTTPDAPHLALEPAKYLLQGQGRLVTPPGHRGFVASVVDSMSEPE